MSAPVAVQEQQQMAQRLRGQLTYCHEGGAKNGEKYTEKCRVVV